MRRARAGGPILALALLVVASIGAAPVTAQEIAANELNDLHVRRAIDAIVEELYARKEPNRFWDPKSWTYREHGSEAQAGGYTALATLALLYAGESYQDPRLREAVEHLRQLELEGTYAVATRAHVWGLLPRRFQRDLEADAKWLGDAFSDRAAGWDYTSKPRTSRLDNSLRQYGALGLWEAAKRGVAVDERLWQRLEEGFIESQLRDGGWNYQADEAPPRGSMTAAGLTVLFITQDFLHGRDHLDLGGRRNPSPADEALDRGLAWMENHFAPDRNPGRDLDFYYYLYGIERVGLASGYRRFGEHDWYREGATELLRRLCRWDDATQTMSVHMKLAGEPGGARIRTHHLAFALMFLSRGRVPVAFNKLSVEGLAWNNRPRDVARLTRSIADASESGLSWQIVDEASPPETWLDAPVLYLASNESIPWVDDLSIDADAWQRRVVEHGRRVARAEISASTPAPERPTNARLDGMRRYLNLGGTLLAVSEGDGRAFASSVERMGTLLYPHLTWRELPADHFVYTTPRPIEGNRIKLRALGNGVRELIILASGTDLARAFQDPEPRDRRALELGANVYFYASELGRPRPRLARHSIEAHEVSPSRSITIVHAMHEGNWRPEPLALEHASAMLGARHDLDVLLIEHPLRRIHTLPRQAELVVVQGVDARDFDPAEHEAIKAYVEAGGVILFETPGGRGGFTTSAELMATELFQRSPRRLTRNRVLTGRDIADARKLSRVDYRPYALQTFESRENAPRLRGIAVDGDVRVLFSREDLAHAMLDQPMWGVAGYTPNSARDVFANIVLHAVDLAESPEP